MNTTTTQLLQMMLEVMEEQGNLCCELADARDARVLAMWERLGRAKELLHKLEKENEPPKKKGKQPQLNGIEHTGGITEGKGKSMIPTTPQSKRVADIFHRRHTTAWSEKEIAAYKKLKTIPETDLAAVEDYYKSGAMYLRRDLLTFLNNFSGELDRARAWQAQEKAAKRSTFTA